MKALAKTRLRVGSVLAATALLVAQAACSYKQTPLPEPVATCVTTDVKYQTNVWPILKANCRDACHNDRDAAAYYNFSMDQFSQVQYYCTTVPPGVSGNVPWLLGNIKHLSNGYSNMPVGGNKLSDCDIAVIEAWIKAGAQNN
ncbi:MAG: hypothetical protein EOO37_01615 [Cytophagaceae bacterium]|nr:MAG: hypothetical protein EOO37_01615 [Cytophagaceae bacterium]